MWVYCCKVLPGSTANWWERSPNASNSNNFCNVNSNGNANNNNANNSNGVAPDFKKLWVAERRPSLKGAILPEGCEAPKQAFDISARTLLAWQGIRHTLFHVSRLRRYFMAESTTALYGGV